MGAFERIIQKVSLVSIFICQISILSHIDFFVLLRFKLSILFIAELKKIKITALPM